MPIIDLSFRLVGQTLPLDHGYPLLSALTKLTPALHANPRAGVHPIRGRRITPGVLGITESSRLKLRIPSEDITPYLGIAGQVLHLGEHRLRVGIPSVECLIPAPYVASRLVTFRNAMDAERFLASARASLSRLEIGGQPALVPSSRETSLGQPIRRVLRIKDKKVVGYSLRVAGLTAEESLLLQETGLGGRRRMGCGVFLPMPEHTAR